MKLLKWSILLLSSMVISCSGVPAKYDPTHFVPIQLARITQTESFTQVFDLKHLYQITEATEEKSAQDQVLDRVFIEMLGEFNWQYLKDLYGAGGSIKEEIDNGDVFTKGFINMTFYLNPYDHKKVIIEGFGRWFVVRKSEKQRILLSGDVHIKPEEFNINDLKKGELKIHADLIVTRIPKHSTYYHKSNVRFSVKINNTQAKHKVYSLDYSHAHQAYLIDDKNEVLYYGKLTFSPEKKKYKIIDLRGIGVIENDYGELSKKKQ